MLLSAVFLFRLLNTYLIVDEVYEHLYHIKANLMQGIYCIRDDPANC